MKKTKVHYGDDYMYREYTDKVGSGYILLHAQIACGIHLMYMGIVYKKLSDRPVTYAVSQVTCKNCIRILHSRGVVW